MKWCNDVVEDDGRFIACSRDGVEWERPRHWFGKLGLFTKNVTPAAPARRAARTPGRARACAPGRTPRRVAREHGARAREGRAAMAWTGRAARLIPQGGRPAAARRHRGLTPRAPATFARAWVRGVRARPRPRRACARGVHARAPAASAKFFLRLDANRSGELEEGALGALVAARLDVIARAVVITNGRACALGCRRRARRVRSPHHVTGAGALTFASVRARRARTLRMRANDSEFNTLMNYPTVDLTRLVPRR